MELKKNPNSDLERIRGSFLLAGILIAASVLLVAFEWVGFERTERIILADDGGLDDEDIEELVAEPPATPPPPPPPPPAPPEELEVVEDDAEVEETEIQFLDEADDIPPPPDPTPAPVVDDQIYEVVEDQPEFPGGQEALFRFLGENIQYPQMAKEADVQGRVFVSFVVGKDGKIGEVKILRGLGYGLDEEAIRVVKMMPDWKPGMQRGKPVKVRYKIPILFRLRR